MDDPKDIVDVEFETVGRTQPKNEAHPAQQPRLSRTDLDQRDDDQLAVFGKKTTKNQQNGMSLPVFSLIAATCMVIAFYFSGGHVLFNKVFDGTAASDIENIAIIEPENLLQFEDLDSTKINRNGSTFLTIRATIANKDKIARQIPTIMVELGDEPSARRTFRINRGEILNPGERLIFTNTLPAGDSAFTKPHLSFLE